MPAYKYPYTRYNRYDVLRVNIPTACATLFLSRHILSFIVIGIAFSRAAPDSKNAFGGLFEPIFMATDIPALLLLIAMLARHPKSGRAIRALWRAGPYLLSGSAALYGILLYRQLGGAPEAADWRSWLMIGGTVLSVAYVFLSPYARDLFRQFPAPEPEDGKPNG